MVGKEEARRTLWSLNSILCFVPRNSKMKLIVKSRGKAI